jgi:hypothetical protein
MGVSYVLRGLLAPYHLRPLHRIVLHVPRVITQVVVVLFLARAVLLGITPHPPIPYPVQHVTLAIINQLLANLLVFSAQQVHPRVLPVLRCCLSAHPLNAALGRTV